MNLSEVEPGTMAKIKKITGDSNLKTRFLDMGLTKGTYVKVVKKAPLNDLIEVEIRGYNLSLRMEEAKHIEVE